MKSAVILDIEGVLHPSLVALRGVGTWSSRVSAKDLVLFNAILGSCSASSQWKPALKILHAQQVQGELGSFGCEAETPESHILLNPLCQVGTSARTL